MAASAILLTFYGCFLIVCGIVSVALIGMKAKTALASGGLSGTIALVLAYLIASQTFNAVPIGLFVVFALFIVFAWRSAKTLFRILEMLKDSSSQQELNGKAIAFLIISLMAVVSVFTFVLLLINWQSA